MGCEGCLDLVQIAQGPQGPTGPTGATGANGSNGTNGTNGIALLTANHGNNSTANNSYTDLHTGTITISAAQMSADEDSIEIRARYYFSQSTSGANAKARILIGGISVTLISGTFEPGLNKTFPFIDLHVVVTRKSATTADVRVTISTSTYGYGSYATETVITSASPQYGTYEIIGTGVITWASGNNIQFQGLVNAGGASDLIKLGFYEVTSLKKA